MKRIIIAITTLLFFSSASKSLNPMLTRSVLEALQNERAAAARYEAFAVRATEEGYPGAAALFHAEARAELVHAARFENFLKSRGVDVPAADTPAATVSSTSNNLRTAIDAEQRERDSTYLKAYNDAKLVGDEEVIKLFDVIRDAETEHLNLDTAANRDLSKMKQAHHYYVCAKCGYTTDLDLPFCASCRGHEMERFE